MRVLQINVSVNVGSTGKIAHEIGMQIQENGGTSMIAYGRGYKASSSQTIQIGSRLDQGLHLLGTRIFDAHGLYSTGATRAFIGKIKQYNVQLIHLHNIHGYYLNYIALFDFLKELSTPVVWTLHDCWAFTGHCAYFSHVACEKWKTSCFKCPLKKTYPASMFVDGSKRNFRIKKSSFKGVGNLTIVTVSQWLQKLVTQSFLGDYPVQTIYNGINTDVFRPLEKRVCEATLTKYQIKQKFVLGVSNIWTERKRLKDFIELRRILDPRITIVLVGLNQSQIKKLPDNIIGIMRTDDQEELAQLYSSAELFVNCSVLETFGLVTAEALSCGTPVVVYNTTASPELVKEGNGHIVEPGDIQHLEGVISKVLMMKEADRVQLSIKCRESAVSMFDMRKQNQKYISLYKKLIDSSNEG